MLINYQIILELYKRRKIYEKKSEKIVDKTEIKDYNKDNKKQQRNKKQEDSPMGT